MTRGFVTLATGDDKYYKAAVRLLHSYHYHDGKERFAIICDRENKYTKEFDDVFVLEECCRDYRDKFRLFEICPYEYNFFIEPDCLVYKNIDAFWDMFENATDISSFGYNEVDWSMWFSNPDDIKKRYNIEKIALFNPGYIYYRKGDTCNKFYKDLLDVSNYILNNKDYENEKKIFVNGKLRDDPILCIALEMNNCSCAVTHKVGKCVTLPSIDKTKRISLAKGKLDVVYKSGRHFDDCYILHFSSRRLDEGYYKWQSLILSLCKNRFGLFVSKMIELRVFLYLFEFFYKGYNRIIGIRK